jgi:protein-disulfide isomerase
VKPGETPPNGEKLVEIVVYGDYQEENTVKLDAQIKEAMEGRTNVRYVWRQYPVDPSCNTTLPPGVPAASVHAKACLAAKAAEAAGMLGGEDAYWKMHAWLMENWKTLDGAGIEKAAKGFGWDVEKFKALQGTPNVAEAILEDCQAAKLVGLTRLPYVIVNDKVVPRVLREGDNVMKRIVEEGGGPNSK